MGISTGARQLFLRVTVAHEEWSSRMGSPIWECFRRYDTAGARFSLSLLLPSAASWNLLVARGFRRCYQAWRARSPPKVHFGISTTWHLMWHPLLRRTTLVKFRANCASVAFQASAPSSAIAALITRKKH